MEAGLRCWRGGIRSLLELIRQHREAIEYDLIALGLRLDWLGTERLSWRDLWVIVRQSPPTAATVLAVRPDAAWGIQEHLLAVIFDALQVSNWQRGSARRGDFPKPTARPGVEPESKNKIGAGAGISMKEMADRLGWPASVEPD